LNRLDEKPALQFIVEQLPVQYALTRDGVEIVPNILTAFQLDDDPYDDKLNIQTIAVRFQPEGYISWEQFVENGSRLMPEEPVPTDTNATILYTSGSTPIQRVFSRPTVRS
jgi:acyl-coenzyme A synthetase/AMP-(fatty) acid ligase